jgi:hypothetical protein
MFAMFASFKHLAFAVLAAATFSVASSQVVAAPQTHACTVYTTPSVPMAMNDLNGVSADGPSDAWTIGYHQNPSVQGPIVERWNGAKWSVISVPAAVKGMLSGVAAVSPTNVWMVGNTGYTCSTGRCTLILHWDGSKLRVVRSPPVPGSDSTLTAVAANGSAVWAVGSYFDTARNIYRTLTESFDGASWHVVPSPNVNAINDGLVGVTVVSSTVVWAVGRYTDAANDLRSMALNWNGSVWRLTRFENLLPKGAGVLANAISSASASDVWIADINQSGLPSTALLQHYDGAHWRAVVPSPSGVRGAFIGIATPTISAVFGVGYDSQTSNELVEENTGGGWAVLHQNNPPSGGNQLLAAGAIPGTTSAWAVGYAGSLSKTLAELCT